MPIALHNIRAELMPGLRQVMINRIPEQWDKLFNPISDINIATISPQTAIACGIAATIIRNPVVSRRFLASTQ